MKGGYNRPLVEQLLPAVWDAEYAFGMRNPVAARPIAGCRIHSRRDGTPKEDCACVDSSSRNATVDKKKGSSLNSHLADIRQA